jgi:hypothetical protein
VTYIFVAKKTHRVLVGGHPIELYIYDIYPREVLDQGGNLADPLLVNMTVDGMYINGLRIK